MEKATKHTNSSAATGPGRKATPFFSKAGGRGFFRGGAGNPSGRAFFSKGPSGPSIQPKLTVGQPNDVYEKEADAMADKVVQRKPIFESKAEPPDDTVMRKCAHCEQEEKLHKKSDGDGGQGVSANVESGINASKGSGSALPDRTREHMESSFGADLSKVRIHDNSSAASMNQELKAQAFTHGSDIFFNRGKYDPGSKPGQHLLAHELTHVIQQNPLAKLQTKPLSSLLGPAPLSIQKLSLSDVVNVVGGPAAGALTKSLGDYFNISLPDDPVEAIGAVIDILETPPVSYAIAAMPGFGQVLISLKLMQKTYQAIKYIIDNKDKIIAEIQAWIEKKLDETEPKVKAKLQEVFGFLDHRHFIAIWQAHLLPMLQHLKDNWWQTIKDTLWEQIWPFEGLTSVTAKAEDRKGLGKDLGELYDQFVEGFKSLKAMDLSKFADAVLMIQKGLVGIVNRFYGWIAIIIIASETLAGAGIAGFFSGGALSGPGAAAGFGAGLATAGSVGEALLIATVAADTLVLLKSVMSLHDFDSMLVSEQLLKENNEYYKRIASTSLSLTLTGILFLLSYLGGKIAEALLGKVVKFLPKSLQEVLENIKIGMKGGKPGAGGKDEPLSVEKNPPELDPEFTKLREAVKTPENIKTVTDPQLLKDYDLEVKVGDHTYRRSKSGGGWCRYSDPICGFKLDDVNAVVDKALGLDVPKELVPGETLTVPYKGGKARAEFIGEDGDFVKIKVKSKSGSGDITQSIRKEDFARMLKEGEVIRWTEQRARLMKNRPPYEEGLVDKVWDSAKQPDGKVYDPHTKKELTWDKTKSRFDQWHMGHKPGKEYAKLVDDLVNEKITFEEFLKEYNNPNNYWPEDPAENLSHAHEE